jgi:putative oligomerization/nucleic acid binding protein
MTTVFGDNHRLRKHLREHGKAAGAELLDFKQRPWANTRGGGEGIVGATKMVYTLRLRVTPEDEPAFDTEITDEWSQFSEPSIGMKVPVLYDPKHHSKVVLDTGIWGSRVGLRQHWQSEVEADQPPPERAARGSTAPSPEARGGQGGAFADEAAAFSERAAAFRDQAAAMRPSTEALAAIMRAKESGDQVEVERLKAELKQRMAGSPASADQVVVGGASAAASSDPLERLEKLADLHDRGVLTDAEFAAEKAKLLRDS